MDLKSRAIAAVIGTTFLAVASVAAAQTTPPATPQAGQETTRSQTAEQVNRMIERCTGMMGNWSR